jgi:hypothetical protein
VWGESGEGAAEQRRVAEERRACACDEPPARHTHTHTHIRTNARPQTHTGAPRQDAVLAERPLAYNKEDLLNPCFVVFGKRTGA